MRKRTLFLWRLWLGIVYVLVLASPVQGASGAADGTYTITMTQIELSQDSGSTYTTVYSGSSTVNIASVDAGATVAGLVSGAVLDPGTYDCVRVTLGSNLVFKGYVNNPTTSDTIYTDGDTEDGTGTAFSTNTAGVDTPGSDYAASTFPIGSSNRTQTICGQSIEVAKGASPKTVVVQFDTTDVLTQSSGVPSLSPPDVNVTKK